MGNDWHARTMEELTTARMRLVRMEQELARVTAERDAAIRECADWATKAGRAEGKGRAMDMRRKDAEAERDAALSENGRLFRALDEIATKTTFNADVAISMMQIARAALKQG